MYRCLPLLIVLALIPGCGLLYELFHRETGSPELKAFESEKELADYFTQEVNVRNSQFDDVDTMWRSEEVAADGSTGDDAAGGEGGAPAPEAPTSEATDGGDINGSDTDYSQTTIQEEGVDESDVVKTDGTYLYIIRSEWDDSTLRIVRVSPPEQLALLSEVSLEGYGQEIYLHDGKVVALTQTYGGFFMSGVGGVAVESEPEVDDGAADDGTAPDEAAGDDGATDDASDSSDAEVEPNLIAPDGEWEYQYERPRTIITIVDASVPESPVVLSETKFDGSQYSSRMIDGVLHFVLANYQEYYYDVLPMLGRPELDVSTTDIQSLLPDYERVDGNGGSTSGDVVTWESLYHPSDPDGFGVVSIVSLDVDNDAAFTAVGIVAEPGLIYSSLNALYLTDTDYNFLGDMRGTTDIYKIAYVDRGAQPSATGTVSGRILNQYSMGEYNGYLRVATTVDATWSPFGERTEPHNNVYVLGQTGTTFDVVGRVENIAPGETIQSARFMGARGYVVTFEQTDPLFTLDLSDPTAPTIVGELEVPGFSTFLVPMDDNHLLAVGQYIPEGDEFFNWGVQLSIFDVTDFANPQRTANVVIGDEGGAYSEALYNPKAFTYFAQEGLLALPISIYEYMPWVGIEDGGATDVDGTVTVTDDDVPVTDDGSAGTEEGMGDTTDAGGDADAGADEGTGGDEGTGEDAAPPMEDGEPNLIEPYVPGGFDGLVVYSVSATGGFTELGRINTRFEDAGYYWSMFTRGVFIGDDVFAVTDYGIRGAPVDDLASVPYELLIESPALPDETWPADGEPATEPAEAPKGD